MKFCAWIYLCPMVMTVIMVDDYYSYRAKQTQNISINALELINMEHFTQSYIIALLVENIMELCT